MKRKLLVKYIWSGTLTIAIVSLILIGIFALCKRTDIAGVCFVVFLFSTLTVCGIAITISLILLYRQIKSDGIKSLKVLAKQFIVFFIVLLIFTYIFQHKLLIWENIAGSVLLSLVYTISFEKLDVFK